MPELPDLQVFSRNLTRALSGKRVKNVSVPNSKKLNVSLKELKSSLEGQLLTKVVREGKELHFEFKNGSVLGLHLMLRGQLYLFEKKNDHKYTIAEIVFDDDTGLAMADFQGQATPTLNPSVRDTLDALSEDVNFTFLKKKLEKSKAAVKNLLLDQHVIRGIGNAYADEILWDAGISPFSISNKIPDEQIRALAKSIKNVLKNAEKSIVKTHPDIISGEIRDFLVIHNAKRTHSPTGDKIEIKKAGARKTYYTKEQVLFR
jgi:formamidopyrimidine-DNA glycosylase